MNTIFRRLVLVVLSIGAVIGAAASAGAQEGRRPNVVFVLLDDLRFDELGCTGHPFVRTPNIDRLAKEGAVFRNAFATTPLCSPSRACFFSGQYAHTNGIRDNVDRSPQSHAMVTWPRLLRDAGYETAFVGKWHMGVDAAPRPGFDRWVCVPGQGKYIDPDLNVNGAVVQAKGYVTDVFNEYAVKFLEAKRDKPFCLCVSHKCVHPDTEQRADGSLADPNAANFVPAERHKSMYANDKPPRRPNAFVPPRKKPALEQKIDGVPPLSRETATDDETIRKRLRMLMAAEDGVGQILDVLTRSGQLDHTIMIFTSDHGYFYGEHCLSVERRLAYEETIRIPLLVRYPPLIKAGVTLDPFVLSIDLAPTLLELGGVKVPENLQGQSLLPLLRGGAYEPRKSVLVELFSDTVFPRVKNMGYRAVRTERWKYIHYVDLKDCDELYDLQADPYELDNRIGDAAVAATLSEMKAELERLIGESR
jgi:N-acetylglucosamine-6-sulfatase